MPGRKIVVFMGSRRLGRFCDKVTKLVEDKLKAKGFTPIIFDPLKMPFEVLFQPLHFMPKPEEAPQWLKDADKSIREADGFVVVCPEYNATIPPPLTNMMDHFSPMSYRHRPCGIVAYSGGSFGGYRVSSMLRPFIAELGMVSVPSFSTIPLIQNAFDKDGKCTNEKAQVAIDRVIEDLVWYTDAIAEHKAKKELPT